MNAWLENVAPLTVEMLPDWAAMTRDFSVGTALLVMLVDSVLVLVVVAATDVILPPETVTETATVPYLWVTVPPAYVPSLNPLAGGAVVLGTVAVVAGAAVVALGAVVVAPALVVAPAAVVVAFVAAAVVAPGVVAPAAVAPGVSPGTEGDSVGLADSVEAAIAAPLVSSVAEVEGSAPTLGTPSV